MTPDPSQQLVIDINSGRHLVLAPPGCGKTQILAERIRLALKQGVKPEDMMCLTFTNRAARGMRERVDDIVGDDQSRKIFVGNVHRFCSHFLFSNSIIPAQSAIIDDDTANSILARYMNEDEEVVANNHHRRRAYAYIVFLSHLMYDIEHGVPKSLRIHTECINKDDIAVMRAIAKLQGRAFDAQLMGEIYNHADYYLDVVRQECFPIQLRHAAENTVMKMRYAHAYTAYKRLNDLFDFEDLLQLTYAELIRRDDNGAPLYKRYSWIQVDEVQDLNMLQLAIINELEADGGDSRHVTLFLGDEQQAIFSFMGAKLSTINFLKEYCDNNVHHLSTNHRSPKKLLDIFNAYAVRNLSCDPTLLPQPSENRHDESMGARILKYNSIEEEYDEVAGEAAKMKAASADGTTAIIVNSNADADKVSDSLRVHGCDHFKISGVDLFSLPDVQLPIAHLSVLNNDHNFLAWSRILKGMKVCATNASARHFVHQLRKVALTPSDLLTEKTYLQRFLETYDNGDMVVFDTETTGLDVFADDIIQIAAERIRKGVSIEKFSVYIATDRKIPEMLGDIRNPIIDEMAQHTLHSHEEALQMFLDFIGNTPLLAHNATYDWHIMNYNMKHYLPSFNWAEDAPVCFDSLRLARLLHPEQKTFKLKTLLSVLKLEGSNSHLADDDVNATVSLVNHCYAKGKQVLPAQLQLLAKSSINDCIATLRRNYGAIFQRGKDNLYERTLSEEGCPALVRELQWTYNEMVDGEFIKPVDKIEYIFRFLSNDVIDINSEPSLKEQLEHHIQEINTFKEADLCGSATIKDRLFVSTIHKAKGLEFDNVFVFDVADGRIPNFYNERNKYMLAEDARKLYVAMTRAKKRLFICYSQMTPFNSWIKRKLSRFVTAVIDCF